jgi:DNA-binding NarL/FixJ family response regulator
MGHLIQIEATPMNAKIKVAILEDEVVTRKGYNSDLLNAVEIDLVGVMRYGEELLPFLASHEVQVLILDMRVDVSPTNSATYSLINDIRKIDNLYPNLCMLAISNYNERPFIETVIEAGVTAYYIKDDEAVLSDLVGLIKRTASGDLAWGPQAHTELRKGKGRKRKDHLLTPRQEEVLLLCAAYPNCSTKDLAEKIGVNPSTIRNTLSKIYIRLDVSTRFGAIQKLPELGLIPRPLTLPVELLNC